MAVYAINVQQTLGLTHRFRHNQRLGRIVQKLEFDDDQPVDSHRYYPVLGRSSNNDHARLLFIYDKRYWEFSPTYNPITGFYTNPSDEEIIAGGPDTPGLIYKDFNDDLSADNKTGPGGITYNSYFPEEYLDFTPPGSYKDPTIALFNYLYYVIEPFTDGSGYNDDLLFNDTVAYSLNNTHQSIIQGLNFSQGVWPAKETFINERLTFYQIADNQRTLQRPIQSIYFRQVLIGTNSKLATNTLQFIETISYNMSRTRVFTQTLSLQQFAPNYLNSLVNRVPTDLPFVSAPSITFQYGALDVVLRGYEFGDSVDNDYTRIQRPSRGNTLIVYRDPTWLKGQTLKVAFTSLKNSEVTALQNLILKAIGRVITLTNHLNQVMSVIVTNPDFAIITNGRDGSEISLELYKVS